MKIKYEKGDTFLHRLNPLTRLLVLVAYSIAIFTFDSLEIELICFLALLLIMALLRSKALLSLVVSKYLLSFVLLIFILGSAVFVFTTDPNELAYALMKAGLPYRFGFMLVTAIRFIPIFESEAGTVRNAQAARGLEIDQGGARGILKTVRYTIMPLIVSALSKVDVLVISMEGRAFGLTASRSFLRPVRFGAADSIISLTTIITLTLLVANVWLGFFTLPHLILYY